MTTLFACLGIGKGTWGHVARLIATEEWDRVVLLSSDFGKENFKPEKECEWILLNNRAGFVIIKDAVKEKLPEGELALSLASGSGKEHMAVLVALRESNRDYKIVTLTGDGVKYY
ncbi:hypothetical protein KKE06_03775 [Candidatus Micrarchaeota archaeon]|nr:hypothetical protein [Candidatus Micrarchaeota archaeon]MBU1930367.1 hypothetical protein [Candidatus Micrarchaeota archaeon]